MDGFAIRAYSELFFVGRICSSWDGLVEKCEGSLEFWDAPGGVEKKITEKEKIAEKRR